MDLSYMHRAIECALEAERQGNFPIGAVIVLENQVIAEAGGRLLVPTFHPGRHAETQALGRVSEALWERRREMTCYTTLEPCVMCAGALIVHGLGCVVFGANFRLKAELQTFRPSGSSPEDETHSPISWGGHKRPPQTHPKAKNALGEVVSRI